MLSWKETETGLRPVLLEGKNEVPVVWAPQRGSQEAFLECPLFEALNEGPRGTGKTDALLMTYLQHVGRGYGQEWRGILFRRTFPELTDVINKSLNWFPKIFPGAKYNRTEHFWKFPTNETLYFRHFLRPEDYWSYHGHAYPWQGWEEMTTWPSQDCLTVMFACARSPYKGIPIMVRGTCNPYGLGHNWVKARYHLPIPHGRVVGPILDQERNMDGDIEPARVVIHSHLEENKVLLYAQPDYIQNIKAAARNPEELRAWIHGDWDITSGGMFDDIWDHRIHMVPDIPYDLIPKSWFLDRAYDHGQSHPFSVGWWAQSSGESFEHEGYVYGAIPGDLYRINEWYGWNGSPNKGSLLGAPEIAQGIIEREKEMGLHFHDGAADGQIFNPGQQNKEVTVASTMSANGVDWIRADKSQGSRKKGWEAVRVLMKNALQEPREEPGIYACHRCKQFQRTVPVLPRSDYDLDDVSKEAEDHIGDETRYRVRRAPPPQVRQGDF